MREKEKYILLQDPIKFSDLDIGDCFIFLSKYLKNSIVYKKITNDSYRSELDPRIKINEHDEKFFVAKLDKDYIQFNEENKTTVTPPEIKEKEKCNNSIHSIFTFVTEGLICSECHTLLATEIDSKFYWNVFDSKVRDLIKENVSLANLFREWASFNKDSSIDQTSIINNQAAKIAAQEAEIKRLEKIIINQAEIIGKGSNG